MRAIVKAKDFFRAGEREGNEWEYPIKGGKQFQEESDRWPV
jgi:hypothetical protein